MIVQTVFAAVAALATLLTGLASVTKSVMGIRQRSSADSYRVSRMMAVVSVVLVIGIAVGGVLLLAR